ncbi:hypothetical protein B0H13DRAFT_1850656 [Mycena leptocephala]|nr:hypothetical protein B0H13DRAFT_1850656 [Mycena leptocephala]
MSQDGLKNAQPVPSYTPLEACLWEQHKIELSVIDTPKVSTALPEISPPKTQHWRSQLDDDDEILGNPEHHRGREKPIQVSLEDLTEGFKARMNEPATAPTSFNKEQLRINAELFRDMPVYSHGEIR